MTPIYLDYNATTPIDPAVVEAMLPFLKADFGNPSSGHPYGKTAREAVERARAQVARLINASPEEIVFTGGGSEASNLAIKGVLTRTPRRRFGFRTGGDVITSAVEHPATFGPCLAMRRFGCRVFQLEVDRYGTVDADDVRDAISSRTRLVTVMHSNNEVGTLQPIREIAEYARARGVLSHTDAAQSIGKVPVDVKELGVDLMTIAGHKFYAPKGVGALFVRKGIELEPLLHGADHESRRRAGTENVPGIVALGKAAELATGDRREQLAGLRDRLWLRLLGELGDEAVILNGHPQDRLPNTLNVNFVDHIGSELLSATPEVAASTGSACHDDCVMISPVLDSMGVPPEMAEGAVRLSVGRFTTPEEVDRAADPLTRSARKA